MMAEAAGGPILTLVEGVVGDRTLRACIECPNIYRGGVACPVCDGPGEPFTDDWNAPECIYCGGDDIRVDVASGGVDCIDCGGDQV